MSAARIDVPHTNVIFNRRYDDGEARFHVTVDAAVNTRVTVAGRGTTTSTRAILACLDEVVQNVADGRRTKVFVDLARNESSSLRGQMMLGKWLLRHRDRIDRGAVVGARKGDRRMASGVMRVARLKNVRFFECPTEASGWLSDGR